MNPAKAVRLAGGQQSLLAKVFADHGWPATKQAVSVWVRDGKMPRGRVAFLRLTMPAWFGKGKTVARKNGVAVKDPKPRLPPANLASSKAKPKGRASKLTPKPPFRPGVNGDPDTKI